MGKAVEEIIASAKLRAVDDRIKMEDTVGEFCDALLGFIDVSIQWKIEVDDVLNLDANWARVSPFAARAISLSLLTTKILDTAYEIPKSLMSGAFTSTVVNWRYVVETKNIALMIDLDIVGPMGFLWLNYNMIDQAKVRGAGKDSELIALQAKRILCEAGFGYDGNSKEPWAKIDERRYSNSISRSKYVWSHREFPPEVSEQLRTELAASEESMIRASNKLAHPTLASPRVFGDNLHAMMLSTVLEPMAVMLAYKVAASELAGWEKTKTVGEQFLTYPHEYTKAKALSFKVKEIYDYCFEVFRNQWLGGIENSNPLPGAPKT